MTNGRDDLAASEERVKALTAERDELGAKLTHALAALADEIRNCDAAQRGCQSLRAELEAERQTSAALRAERDEARGKYERSEMARHWLIKRFEEEGRREGFEVQWTDGGGSECPGGFHRNPFFNRGALTAAEALAVKMAEQVKALERERDEYKDALKWERVAFEDRRVRLDAAEERAQAAEAQASALRQHVICDHVSTGSRGCRDPSIELPEHAWCPSCRALANTAACAEAHDAAVRADEREKAQAFFHAQLASPAVAGDDEVLAAHDAAVSERARNELRAVLTERLAKGDAYDAVCRELEVPNDTIGAIRRMSAELAEARAKALRDAARWLRTQTVIGGRITPGSLAAMAERIEGLASPTAAAPQDGGAPRMFPIHSEDRRKLKTPPYAIEWAFLAPHEARAWANHDQSLERLAERGGCGWDELYAIVRNLSLRDLRLVPLSLGAFREAVLADFEKWKAAPPAAEPGKHMEPFALVSPVTDGQPGSVLLREPRGAGATPYVTKCGACGVLHGPNGHDCDGSGVRR